MKRVTLLFIIISSFLLMICRTSKADKLGWGNPEFRGIGGVSMGGYGAMNIGLSHPNLFNTIASLGGPLDMGYLLKFIEVDRLGNYSNPDPYPDRDTLIDMLKDLCISFGNPVYYNPDSPYYPPGISNQNARKATTLLNFKDGTYNPDGRLPVITFTDPGPNDWVEVLLGVDINNNGKLDWSEGEPIIRQFHEPFNDLNQNGFYDDGEPFEDVGLDGVSETGDVGERDGEFTFNPNYANYLTQDPLTHAATMDLSLLQNLNLYIDAGKADEFQFNVHAENFVNMICERGLPFLILNDFPVDFPQVNHFSKKRVFVRYPGGHVGFDKENLGLSFKRAKKGIREAITVANRFTTLFAFVSDHWPDGEYGTNLYELLRYPSKMRMGSFYSPSLKRKMKFGFYLPPGYNRNESTHYPVLYLLGGYNMSIEGIANSYIKSALDLMILGKEIQKMIVIIPDGRNYKTKRGHFFVNQIDQEHGDRFMDAFFDLVHYIDEHFRTK